MELLLLAILGGLGIYAISRNSSSDAAAPGGPVGGAKDAHGCDPSSGYLWCEKEGKCVRPFDLAAAKGFPNTADGFAKYCGSSAAAASDKTCPYGPDKPIGEMDESVRGTVLAALSMETDPEELDKLAQAMDAICQTTAATALRKKSSDIKALLGKNGLPPTTDPSIVTIPIPGVTGGSPEPKTSTPPPDTDAFEVLAAEPDTNAAVPIAGCQSLPTTQWWTGPYSKKSGVGLRYVAESITGNAERYVEFMIANPEKATVGDPKNPLDTGYSFTALADGERLRVPPTWNSMIDQMGDSSGGSIYTVCSAGVTTPTTGLPGGFSPMPGGFGIPGMS